jgi:glutathione S-transferase
MKILNHFFRFSCEQFTSGFTTINPNQKIPVLVDRNGPGGKSVSVYESGHILLYLAEKSGKFIPQKGTPEYVECLNWLFFQHGSLGPFFGQFGHFYKYAPIKIRYAIERFVALMIIFSLGSMNKRLNCGRFQICHGDEATSSFVRAPVAKSSLHCRK